MAYRIRLLPAGREFPAEENETILEAAGRAGVVLAYSCRSGHCASCKARIASGTIEPGHYDERALSEAERASGLALLCQAEARSDLEIQANEIVAAEGMVPRFLPARIAALDLVAPDVMRVSLTLAKGARFRFLAGQYIEVVLSDGRRRSYSIANAPVPEGGEALELHIRRVPDGAFSAPLFTTTKARDLVRLHGPLGTFFLREEDLSSAEEARPVILISGGTGFAPVKSMLEDAFRRRSPGPFHLYRGARSRADLYLDALPREWAAAHAGFHYVPVIAGFVHEAVLADFPDLSGVSVYASGPPAMIEAIRKTLVARGLDPARLHYDSFESAARQFPLV